MHHEIPEFTPFILLFAGMFSVAGAAFQWPFFMSNLRARMFIALIGREATRALYVVIGAVLMGFAVAIWGGVVT